MRLATVAKHNADPLYNPAAGLSGQELYAAATKVTNAAVNPKVDALNRQLTSATTQGSALAARGGDYYRQLAQDELGKVAQQKAIAGMLNQQTSAVGAQTQAAFGQMGQAEQQRQAADTALRGQGLGGDTTTVPAEIQAQQGTAATLQQAAGNQAAAQGADWSSLANAMAASRQARGGEVQGQLLNRVANQQQQLRGQIADTESTRGDEFAKNLLNLRQSQFENAVTTSGLNIKQADIQAQLAGVKQRAGAAKAKTTLDTQKFKADQAYKQAQIDIKRGVDPVTGKRIKKGTSAADALNKWKLDYARTHGHLPSTGTPAAPKPKQEPADVRHTRETVNSLSTSIKQLANGRDRTRVANILRSRARAAGQRLPDDLLSAALDLGMDGHVSPRNVQMLKQVYGVTVPAAWRRRPRTPRQALVDAARGPGVQPLSPTVPRP